MDKCRIVFFGSGDFPIPTFKRLIADDFSIVGLVTSNDRTKCGERLFDIAKNNGIPTIIPSDLNSDDFKQWLRDKDADIFCVISYKMLPPDVISIPWIKSFNVHASLLPFLRGAAPIHWAIRLGFAYTGLTSFVLNSRMDEGDIILNRTVEITDDDTLGTLTDKLSDMCCDFTVDTIMLLADGCHTIQQPTCGIYNQMFRAPKLDKSYMMLSYDDKANPYRLARMVRSLYPYYGLRCPLRIYNTRSRKSVKMDVKIHEVELKNVDADYMAEHRYAGIVTDGKTYFHIHPGNFESCMTVVSVKKIQREGKKMMGIEEFLRGFQYARSKDVKIMLNIKLL